jgi:hypothetical protein
MTDVVLEAAIVPCIWDNKEQIYVPVYSYRGVEIKDRIEQLEAALRLYMDMMAANKIDIPHTYEAARAALAGEKKDD